MFGHATRRWLTIVLAVAMAVDDVPTLAHWSAVSFKSVGTLKRWCSLCDTHAGDSLDFARALRVVLLCAGTQCEWYEYRAIAEKSTLHTFLSRAGLARMGIVPDIDSFVTGQGLITNKALINAIRLTYTTQLGS